LSDDNDNLCRHCKDRDEVSPILIHNFTGKAGQVDAVKLCHYCDATHLWLRQKPNP
jgi:hypothetical protein